MVLLPRLSNELTPETGYTFGTIAVAGATPRSSYYMLRDADPTARLYRAIVIAVETYDDADTLEDNADRDEDLSYVIARLRLSDLWEFTHSYHDPKLQWKAARAIQFKGLVHKRDFEDFLLHPASRLRNAKRAHRDSFAWFYNFVGTRESIANFHVDWGGKTLNAPPGADPELVRKLTFRLLDPLPPATGEKGRYLKYWLGKTYERYRDSPTRLIFLRLPRGGFVRPDQPHQNPHSSVRELAAQPNVTLIDEHFFDSLEKPELFSDDLHLNGPGMDRFSIMLTREVSRILGPPR
jgi:hypothetical protein